MSTWGSASLFPQILQVRYSRGAELLHPALAAGPGEALAQVVVEDSMAEEDVVRKRDGHGEAPGSRGVCEIQAEVEAGHQPQPLRPHGDDEEKHDHEVGKERGE